jgi:cytochrome c551/c552
MISSAEVGKIIFEGKECISCHVDSKLGPSLQDMPKIYKRKTEIYHS